MRFGGGVRGRHSEAHPLHSPGCALQLRRRRPAVAASLADPAGPCSRMRGLGLIPRRGRPGVCRCPGGLFGALRCERHTAVGEVVARSRMAVPHARGLRLASQPVRPSRSALPTSVREPIRLAPPPSDMVCGMSSAAGAWGAEGPRTVFREGGGTSAAQRGSALRCAESRGKAWKCAGIRGNPRGAKVRQGWLRGNAWKCVEIRGNV